MSEQFSALSDEALAGRWRQVGLKVPRELVDETLRRGGRMIPHLGTLLLDDERWLAPSEEPEGWAPAHALFLIQAMKDPVATPYVKEFLREGLGGDWLTEEGARLVFSLGPGALDAMWAVATDPLADEWGRGAAVDGLAMLGLAHESLRPDLVARFRTCAISLLNKPIDDIEDADEIVMDSLLDGLASLHDEDSRDLIERAGAWRDSLLREKEDILQLYQDPFENILQERLADPLEHFNPERLAEYAAPLPAEDDGAREGDEDLPLPFVNPEPKVGRNDPCPCGSGKKHKKCCGKE